MKCLCCDKSAPTCTPRALWARVTPGTLHPMDKATGQQCPEPWNACGCSSKKSCLHPSAPLQPIPEHLRAPFLLKHLLHPGVLTVWYHSLLQEHRSAGVTITFASLAVLTWAVRAFLLLLHTQSFSRQHPAACSCAGAHSKHPHPTADGAESTFTWLTPFLQSEEIHSKLLSQGSTSPSHIRNVAHQRGQLQETTLSSHPAASLCRQGSDGQGNTHISQSLFCTGGRTKSFGNCQLTS